MTQALRRSVGIVAVAALAAAGGYWFGTRGAGEAAHADAGAPAQSAANEKKILFYRNPMGLPDTSPTPKKDPMGMDYLPVYAGEAEDDGASSGIRVSSEKIQKLGVRTEPAAMRVLDRTVRAAGRIEPDERRLYTIAPKFEGYVERLHVNVTGQAVAKGQPLFEVYSPELVSAQREYVVAARGVDKLQAAGSEVLDGMKQLAESSLLRLQNWDISEEQVKALARSGDAKRTLSFRAPVAGIVTEKKALQGMRFMPGEALYQIADLSSVWVIADVFEQDIGLVRQGANATVRIDAYPDKRFEGRISYVYPTLNAATRTVPVRVELANPGLLLKPAMFAQVELPAAAKTPVLTIPNAAVIDSGTRRIVLVQTGEGRFAPREVRLGARSDHFVQVLGGLADGEPVVTTANFLIDAESNLKAAVAGFSAASADTGAGAAKTLAHRASGRVDSLDPQTGNATIEHGPVDSLKWPAMTMEFSVPNAALREALKAGARIDFEFVERAPGEWVITAARPAGAAAPQAAR